MVKKGELPEDRKLPLRTISMPIRFAIHVFAISLIWHVLTLVV